MLSYLLNNIPKKGDLRIIFLRRVITVNAFSVFESKLTSLRNNLSVTGFVSDINERTFTHSLLLISICIF